MTGRGARRRRRSGSLLVITLWLIIILSVLAVAIGRYLSIEVRLTRYRVAREQARALARSGIYLAMQRLAQDGQDNAYDWLGDSWTVFPQTGSQSDPAMWVVPLGNEGREQEPAPRQLEITIVDEDRKLDVNTLDTLTAAQRDQLLGSDQAAQAIIAYEDQDTAGSWETPVLDPPYYPKNGPVVALEELVGVPGVTPDVFHQLHEFTYAVPEAVPMTKVNINTAGREVLVAAGLPVLAEAIIGFRQQGHYFKSLTPSVETDGGPPPFDPADTEFLNARGRLTVASQVFTITSTGRMRHPAASHRIQATVRRQASEDPKVQLGGETFRILAWKDG